MKIFLIKRLVLKVLLLKVIGNTWLKEVLLLIQLILNILRLVYWLILNLVDSFYALLFKFLLELVK